MLDTSEAITLEAALYTRRSVRAFQDKSVAREILEEMLRLASHAPSGSNVQPWQVHVVQGETLKGLAQAMQKAYLEKQPGHAREYAYYADPLPEPYLSRRRACGWGLYNALGIGRDQSAALTAQRARNYVFFDAPVTMIFTIDARMAIGSYLDYGMFLQSLALAARAKGLHSCLQASIAEFPDIVRGHLRIEASQRVICALSLGYADADAIVNTYQPVRRDIAEIAQFHD